MADGLGRATGMKISWQQHHFAAVCTIGQLMPLTAKAQENKSKVCMGRVRSLCIADVKNLGSFRILSPASPACPGLPT